MLVRDRWLHLAFRSPGKRWGTMLSQPKLVAIATVEWEVLVVNTSFFVSVVEIYRQACRDMQCLILCSAKVCGDWSHY